MPSFDLQKIFENLPALQSFHVQNVEDFKQEQFNAVYQKLITYDSLNRLGLELLAFDIDEVKDKLFDILRMHHRTLKTLLLGRNKVSNQFMKDLCNAIKELNTIEEIDLTHLKEANKIDWKDYLESISLLATNRPNNPIKIIISDYQTRSKQKTILDYLSDHRPNVEINYRK